jgi:hypothetical protein
VITLRDERCVAGRPCKLALLHAGALVGIFVGYLKRKKPARISPFLYGLSGAALASVVVTEFTLFRTARKDNAVSTDNVESSLKRWLEAFNLPVVDDPASYFQLKTTFPNGYYLLIRRRKRLDRYVFIESRVNTNLRNWIS